VLKQLRYLHDLAQRNALALLLSLPSGAGLAHELIAGVHGGQVLGGSARDMAQRQAGDLGVLACLGPAMGVADLAGLDAYLRRAVRAPTDSAPPVPAITPVSSTYRCSSIRHLLHAMQNNLRRYLGGQPLLNVVDRSRGY
jgi:hypothetical protein